MKIQFLITPVALALSLICNPVLAAKGKAPANPPAPAAADVEIASQLPKDKQEALQTLISRFNDANKGSRIVLVDRAWDAGAPLTAQILDPVSEEAFLAGKQRYKPLYAVAKDAGVKLDLAERGAPVVAPISVDAKGRLLGLPVALATPVFFVNQDVFRKNGLDPASPPKTWAEVQDAAGKLVDGGVACPLTVARPATALLENTAAWHNEPFVNAKGDLAVNGLNYVRHLARMASWQKSRYLQIFGHGDEAVDRFASGECAMLIAGQSAMPVASKGSFAVGVSALPYYQDVQGARQNTLADGPVLWVSAGRNANEYKTIAKFVAFWLEPTQQIDWMRATGYLPLNRSGAFAASSRSFGSELNYIKVAVDQLVATPATANSRATAMGHSPRVLKVLEEELDGVWNQGKAAKLALDEAVSRIRALGIR
ncbi:sn-glycerol-3-phosphate ABC transporter substrate-binding protein UgpB [Niveibacterium umoris]|uniref:sn-glycerol-3-phosphate-binding periplasmic protein UgpB n=1 Tax=Niveibacterium umoris TaxID=1193620 RepID=A0A840BMY3_9RHOO|nr:extracellular solute-binding protein [Niveibacterium umoris]MBB4011847.1 sn-glycerol 3-phosphate transport system substrate-binding protein [Niveibacterium umoris]